MIKRCNNVFRGTALGELHNHIRGARLQDQDYQSHEHRSERWTIIQGNANVVLNDKDNHLNEGDMISISKKDKHRIINTGDKELIFNEVQLGDYLGEDDIVRYKDDYGRTEK